MGRFFTRPCIELLLAAQLVFFIQPVQAQPALSDTRSLTTVPAVPTVPADSVDSVDPTDPFPHVARAYWVQTDTLPLDRSDTSLPTAHALWARQSHLRLAPASLTKLMSALLVAESSKPEDVVTVDAATMRETGTRLGILQGEQYSVESLLAATLIHSANDACHALAAHMAGSEARFVVRMNRRARDLGLRDTHFANACGHDAENHYSSARDLASLALRVLQYPRLVSLMERVALPITTIATQNAPRSFLLKNTNALLGRYPGVQGMKTGYTPKAGKCLLTYAIRGQHRVLLVMLNAPNRWWDATDILDLAFTHIEHPS